MIAALTLPPERQRIGLYFSLHANANITSGRVARFLKILSAHLQKPLLVIWDRSKIHRSKIIGRLLAKQHRMHVAFFPAYAPELNPVEGFWCYLKQNPLANFTPQDTQSLSHAARYHGKQIRIRSDILRSFLYATPLF
jgi:transposase